MPDFGGRLSSDRGWRLSVAYVTRLLTFLAYAGMALALWIQSMGTSSCYVHNTYKQEFLAKVVSNPFYSSSQIVKHGPPSMFEINQQFSAPYKQQASDLGVFPIISSNPLLHSAFWPVESIPKAQAVAGGSVNLPGRDMQDGVYYFDDATKQIFARGVPSQGGTGPILANMALQSVHGPIKVGSVLPNIARCIRRMPDNPSPSDVEAWLKDLKHVATHSHLRGTCLLTAQQAMVDVTSNYKTSLTAYSSVNMVFMLAVVMWISASFALFYVGGDPKSREVMDDLKASGEQVWVNNRWSWEDVTTLVGILWNLALVAYLIYPGTLDKSNIPLNNAVIAIVAIVAAIAVQWHSAYYSSKKFDSLYNLGPMPQQKQQQDVLDSKAAMSAVAVGPASFFTTANFLSVARELQEMKRGSYQMVLGQPFARQFYYEAIKNQLHVDIVENMEYAITTPLMSAILLASFSPTVPTGTVQLLYLMLLGSHLSCIPAIYMSTLFRRMQKSSSQWINGPSMIMAVYLMLGACYVLQINAIVIKATFFRQLWTSLYLVDTYLQATTILVLAMQGVFLLLILLHVTVNISVSSSWEPRTISKYANFAYMLLNFLLKFGVGWIAFMTASNQAFPAYTCGIWADV